MSKIAIFHESIKSWKFSGYFKFFKKWNFFILLDEEAFCFSKLFSFKLTWLGKNHIKIGFPCSSKEKWSEKLKKADYSFVIFDNESKVLSEYEWKISFNVDISDYMIAFKRILTLDKLDIEDEKQKNFLLKQKLEDIYKKMSFFIMKFPKKERFYLREKIEKQMIDILHDTYIFAYEPKSRKDKSKDIFQKLLILRDFFRLAYNISNHLKDTVYLDLSNDLIEVLKITKTLINKYDEVWI